jgi:hypothetical protein
LAPEQLADLGQPALHPRHRIGEPVAGLGPRPALKIGRIWDLVAAYVEAFVGATYASDAAVVADTDLATWIATAASADASTGGNIRGLPEMSSRAALERVLKSLLYRITVHGIQTLNSTANPALTFVPNFPHCLQRTDIPGPRARIGTRRLLSYLPNTETIGEAVDFYFNDIRDGRVIRDRALHVEERGP